MGAPCTAGIAAATAVTAPAAFTKSRRETSWSWAIMGTSSPVFSDCSMWVLATELLERPAANRAVPRRRGANPATASPSGARLRRDRLRREIEIAPHQARGAPPTGAAAGCLTVLGAEARDTPQTGTDTDFRRLLPEIGCLSQVCPTGYAMRSE